MSLIKVESHFVDVRLTFCMLSRFYLLSGVVIMPVYCIFI